MTKLKLILSIFAICLTCQAQEMQPPPGVAKAPDGSWLTSSVLISREQVQERIDSLKTLQKQLEQQLQMVAGALQDCEFWMSIVDPKPKPAEQKQAEPSKPEKR